jgi:glucose-6-phosphate isomerase
MTQNTKKIQIVKKLAEQAKDIKESSLNTLFKNDPTRAQKYSLKINDIYCDYSKNHIDHDIFENLINWAKSCDLSQKTKDLFSGKHINNTEDRAVLHPALRCVPNKKLLDIIPQDIQTEVSSEYSKMQKFVSKVHNGDFIGSTGEKITTIINIGIGGSDLGPKMIVNALRPYKIKGMSCHFVSNIDATDLLSNLENIDPKNTLFIIASKSFSTIETLTNALSAKEWIINKLGKDVNLTKHFIAVTSNVDKAKEFGIDPNNCFKMWDWVGGRYSLWSSIGLPIALTCGMDNFKELLNGASSIDEHFLTQPLEKNLPAILGLIGAYYRNFWDTSAQAILPYDQYLSYLPDYLQQADMESNGKSVTHLGGSAEHKTAPIIWGGVGTNGQHAYFQLLHQGTHLIPIDFIVAKQNHHDLKHHQDTLIANCIAQAQALMQGLSFDAAKEALLQKGVDEAQAEFLAKHKQIPGNKPSTMFVLDKITPYTLGQLVACYEHKIFTQSVLWDINAFDQWGVELGKVLAGPVLEALQGGGEGDALSSFDSSTSGLIKKFF